MNVLMRFPDGKEKVFTMCYDDGGVQDVRLVDLMVKHGLKGSFYVNSGYLFEKCGRLTPRQILDLYVPAGQEIAIHTHTHPTLDLPPERVVYEYLKDKEYLEGLTGTIIRGSAYPNGYYDEQTKTVLKACGIAYARNSITTERFDLPEDWYDYSFTCRHGNPRLFELGEQFVDIKLLAHHRCRMFCLFGHSYEFDNDNNWHVIEEFAAKIGGHKDIWYATSIEIYDYIQAYRSLRFNVAMTLVQNPTSIDVWLAKDGKDIKVGAGETLAI